MKPDLNAWAACNNNDNNNQRPIGHNAHLNVQLWKLYSAKILSMLHARKTNLSFAMATNQIQQFKLNSYGS